MSKLARFDFEVEPGQIIDAKIQIPDEDRGVIHGVVTDEQDKKVENAAVCLFREDDKDPKEEEKKCDLHPISRTFTDECGQFLFGPLCPETKYVILIWANDACVKEEKTQIHEEEECLKEGKECPKDDKDNGSDNSDNKSVSYDSGVTDTGILEDQN